MSFFPPTRIGRALVTAGLVTAVAVVAPFLLGVVRMVGDEATELPPLTPAGTRTTFLLANPVVWFLAVALVVYVVLWILEVAARASVPAPAKRPAPRRPAARKAPARRPAAPRVAAGTASGGRPAPRKKAAPAPRRKPAPTARKTAAAPRKKAATPAKKAAPARRTSARR